MRVCERLRTCACVCGRVQTFARKCVCLRSSAFVCAQLHAYVFVCDHMSAFASVPAYTLGRRACVSTSVREWAREQTCVCVFPRVRNKAQMKKIANNSLSNKYKVKLFSMYKLCVQAFLLVLKPSLYHLC